MNVFIVNKHVDWITELPDDIRDRVGIDAKYDKACVDGDVVEFSDRDERDEAWDDLGDRDGGLNRRDGDTRIKIKQGKEFEVVVQLIEDGNTTGKIMKRR